MKKVLLLIMPFLFVSVVTFAQNRNISYADDTYRDKAKSVVEVDTSPYELTPGKLFQQASKEFLIGGAGVLVGGALCGVAVSLDDKDSQNAVYIVGGICGLAGVAMGIKGCFTLGKAGKALDRQQPVAYIQPSNNGLGVNLTF